VLIDWFPVIAQLLNFTILVVALKYLLYDRIVKAMEQRRSAIAASEAHARDRAAAAEDELVRLREERVELDHERDGVLEEARQEAADHRRQLLERARADVNQEAEDWRRSLHAHQHVLLADLQRLTGEKAVTITRRLLADLADRTLEEAIVLSLGDRVRQLSATDRAAITTSIASHGPSIVVRSAFELSATGREHVEQVVSELAEVPGPLISWELDPELICGVEIRFGDRCVGWSVVGYLADVEREFDDLLRSQIPSGEREGDT